jgi:hypothetical protein
LQRSSDDDGILTRTALFAVWRHTLQRKNKDNPA